MKLTLLATLFVLSAQSAWAGIFPECRTQNKYPIASQSGRPSSNGLGLSIILEKADYRCEASQPFTGVALRPVFVQNGREANAVGAWLRTKYAVYNSRNSLVANGSGLMGQLVVAPIFKVKNGETYRVVIQVEGFQRFVVTTPQL